MLKLNAKDLEALQWIPISGGLFKYGLVYEGWNHSEADRVVEKFKTLGVIQFARKEPPRGQTVYNFRPGYMFVGAAPVELPPGAHIQNLGPERRVVKIEGYTSEGGTVVVMAYPSSTDNYKIEGVDRVEARAASGAVLIRIN